MKDIVLRDICGVDCSDFAELKPLLRGWIRTIKLFVREWHGDVPWWYNERASVSVLAGAIWKTKGIAFEEYSNPKRRRARRRLSREYSGRVDLHFIYKHKECIAEAKAIYVGASRIRKNWDAAIIKALCAARRDVCKIKPYGVTRLAVVFVRPYFQKGCRAELDEQLNVWLEHIREFDCDAKAWCFPGKARMTVATRGGPCYPGEVMIIKRVLR